MAPLLPVPALLHEHGIEPAPFLRGIGIDPALFDDAENRAPFAPMGQMLGRCAEACGCTHFGLLVGQRYSAETLGELAELMDCCDDVGSALHALVQYLHWHDRGAVPVLLRLSPTRMALGYSINLRGAGDATQIYGTAMAIAVQLMRRLCGADWRPDEVSFAHAAPAELEPYRRLFGAPLRFDDGLSALHFATRWLVQPLGTADPSRRRRIEDRLRAAVQAQRLPIADKVQRALHMMILAGTASAPRLAHFLGLNERALRRRLAEEGTSLQALARQTRFDLASNLLCNTGLPLAGIAAALHYSEATAFTRAFKAWAGVAPQRWRAAPAGLSRPASP